MGKALTGIAEIGAAAGIVAGVILTGGAATPLLALETPLWGSIAGSLAISGIASTAGAIADAIAGNRGTGITTRQPAANAGIIYGEWRVGGVLTYASTTGSHKDQYNKVVTIAGHPIDSIVNLYLDGRQVFWSQGSAGQQTRNGVTFGGAADGSNHYDPGNNRYNFGTLVYAGPHFGNDPVGSYSGDLHANDPNWAPSANGSPYGGDCSWCYVKVEYDTAMFPSLPEYRFTVRGRNTIWDPRTNSYGYTTNWALIMADVLMNPDWGLGVPQAMINTLQLITAANICDELVPLANGTSEPRYTFNGSFDSSSGPGDILEAVRGAASGSLTYSGGQFFIFPAAAYPVSFSWTEDDLIDGIQGSTYRSGRDICNRVAGTFIAPNYPYSPVGNLYNSNGHDPDGYSQNNFNYAYQKTSYPAYAQDQLHGYPTDEWLSEDGGVAKWKTLNMSGVISVATAQRLAKIELLRNRLQRGAYSFKFKLGAYQMAVQDVFALTFPQLGWSQKLLQVTDCSLAVDMGDQGRPPSLYVTVNASDYDPNCYSWSASEELTILDAMAAPPHNLYTVEPLAEITLNSGAAYDYTGNEGIVLPQVQVTWIDPPDAYVTLVDIQWANHGSGTWTSIPPTAVGLGVTYIRGPVAGQIIDVQARSLRGDGASSTWLQAVGYAVSASSISTITTIGVAPGIPYNISNDCTIDSIPAGSSATLRVYGTGGPGTYFNLITGRGSFSIPSAQMTVPYSSSGYVILSILPFNARGHLPGSPVSGPFINGLGTIQISNVATYNQTIGDAIIMLGSYVAIASSGSGGTPGGGGSGGGGNGGSGGGGGRGGRSPLYQEGS